MIFLVPSKMILKRQANSGRTRFHAYYYYHYQLSDGMHTSAHFHDLGMSGPVHEPQNQYYLSLDTAGHSKNSKKNQNHFK